MMARTSAVILTIVLAVLVACSDSQSTVKKTTLGKLRYFNSRGLGESIRMVCHYLGMKLEEERYIGRDGGVVIISADGAREVREAPSWLDVKQRGIETGDLPFGQVPAFTLKYDGREYNLVQSEAILRFLGTKFGLDGSHVEEKNNINMVMGSVGDLRKKYSALVYNSELPSHPEIMDKYVEETLKPWAANMDSFLKKNCACDGPFPERCLVGVDPSIADFAMLSIMECNVHIAPEVLLAEDQYPYLRNHFIRSGMLLTGYNESPNFMRYCNGDSAFFDTPTIPGNFKYPAVHEEEL